MCEQPAHVQFKLPPNFKALGAPSRRVKREKCHLCDHDRL